VRAVNSTDVIGNAVAYSTMWSAPLSDLPPSRSKKFYILWRNRLVEGFVVNFGGQLYAYVNYCIHAGTQLDWWPNEFFDNDRRFLKCSTHGSLYKPETGKCASGPCAGRGLFPLQVKVTNGRVVITSG